MSERAVLKLFEATGVELEYMIVDAETLSVRPISDKLLHAVCGEYLTEVEVGEISWSNELALHVVELKTTTPAAVLEPLVFDFQQHIARVNELLSPLGARLMPTAMHPWMDPQQEMRLWPHEHSPVYEAFHRIFDCRGHGWANLQSVHLNLPFADDAEFGRLHAAVRLVLPLLPALAASSPIVESHLTALFDNRLDVYRTNAAKIPSVSGDVIPEAVFTRNQYGRVILERMYEDIAPHDRDGDLRHEWLNARGAIARFERSSIEIRLLDVQECPLADLAIVAAVRGVLRLLVDEHWTEVARQQAAETAPLAAILRATTSDADWAIVSDDDYLAHFGLQGRGPIAVGEIWRHLIKSLEFPADSPWSLPLDTILSRGPLARRIVGAVGDDLSRDNLHRIYRQLCDSLSAGTMWNG